MIGALAAAHLVAACLKTVSAGVYDGDPTDKVLMTRNVHVCAEAVSVLPQVRPRMNGIEAKFTRAWLLDRQATLDEMGLNRPRAALPLLLEAETIFAGLRHDSDPDNRYTAKANSDLVTLQIATVRKDLAPPTSSAR